MAVATRRYQNYVNGRFVDPHGGQDADGREPGDRTAAVSDVPDSSVEDAREAIEFADRAQRRWQKLAPIERANYLHRIAAGIRKDAEHLARTLSEEQGKPLDQSRGEVGGTANYFDYTAEWARRIEGEVIASDEPNEMQLLLRQPIGVIGGIVPWNFPLYVLARKVAPALLTGNAIVMKPSEITPNSTLELGRIFDEAERSRRRRQHRLRLRTGRRRGAGLQPAHRHGDRYGQHQDGLPGHGARRQEHHEGEPGVGRQSPGHRDARRRH